MFPFYDWLQQILDPNTAVVKSCLLLCHVWEVIESTVNVCPVLWEPNITGVARKMLKCSESMLT